MKNLYKFNLTLLIINLLLGMTVYIGLAFMVITGFVQIISSIWLISQGKKIGNNIKASNYIYLMSAATTLVIFYSIFNVELGLSFELKMNCFYILMVLSAILSFVFVRILYKAAKYRVENIAPINK